MSRKANTTATPKELTTKSNATIANEVSEATSTVTVAPTEQVTKSKPSSPKEKKQTKAKAPVASAARWLEIFTELSTIAGEVWASKDSTPTELKVLYSKTEKSYGLSLLAGLFTNKRLAVLSYAKKRADFVPELVVALGIAKDKEAAKKELGKAKIKQQRTFGEAVVASAQATKA